MGQAYAGREMEVSSDIGRLSQPKYFLQMEPMKYTIFVFVLVLG